MNNIFFYVSLVTLLCLCLSFLFKIMPQVNMLHVNFAARRAFFNIKLIKQ
jgi:hypothetical protein